MERYTQCDGECDGHEGGTDHKEAGRHENSPQSSGFTPFPHERYITRRSFAGLAGCAFASLLVGGLAGCAPQANDKGAADKENGSKDAKPKPEKRTVTNLDGTTIEVPGEVTSVAAIFGPSYERIVAVGAEDAITCDGDFHLKGWPWSNVVYKRLNEVPGIPNAHSDLNVEDLVAQGVQAVFCFPNPKQAEAINNAGMVAIPMASTGKFRDIADSITLYADVFGTDEAQQRAKAYNEYFDHMVGLVQKRTQGISDDNRPGVYLAYTDVLHGYGEKSDMVEVVDLAGGRLVSTELAGSSNIEVTAEQLVEWNPDYIFISHAGSSGNATPEEAVATALATGDFNNVSAVQKGQVNVVPTGVFFWDAGIQKILYLVYLAKTLHPELFEDVDMKQLLIEFYEQFFDYTLTDDQATRILAHMDPA